MRFRKKPVEVDAAQFTHATAPAVTQWLTEHDAAYMFHGDDFTGEVYLEIYTLEGTMTAQPGDWIIRGVQGEFYPVKPQIFAATYEQVT